MRTLLFGLVAIFGLSTVAFAHETFHDFSIGIILNGAKVEVYKVRGPSRLADALSDGVAGAVRGFKNDPNMKELVITGTGGKIVVFDKAAVTGTFSDDLTPQEPEYKEPKIEKKPCWRLVPHCGRCSRVVYVYE